MGILVSARGAHTALVMKVYLANGDERKVEAIGGPRNGQTFRDLVKPVKAFL